MPSLDPVPALDLSQSTAPAQSSPAHPSPVQPAPVQPTTVPAPDAAPPIVAGSWRAYAKLAKLDILDYYLSIPLVAAMLLPLGQTSAWRAAAVLALYLLGELTMVAGMVAFDDVTGYRDGSDIANYGPDAPARRLARKPLVAGTLTERQAIRFGWLAVAACALCWSAAIAVAPLRPWWALVGIAACVGLGFQYTWWLKLSYHGLQELFMAALGWAFVLPAYGLLAGRPTGFVLVQTLVFGLGPLLFGVYSNMNDADGDRAVGRLTVAAIAGPRGNACFIAAVSSLEAALVVGSAVLGLAPWWFPLLMSPALALRAAQYVQGIKDGDVLGARKRGITVHRLSVLLMISADLLAAVQS